MTNWILPANPNDYKFEEAFEQEDHINWHQCRNKVSVGDVLYIYESKPQQCIRFKCEILAIDLPNVTPNDHLYWKNSERQNKVLQERKFMKIKKVGTLQPSLDLEQLKLYGLKAAPQGAMKPKDGLLKFIEEAPMV